MGQCLFILLFFTGVVPLVLPVPRKYYLITEKKTWSDAQAYCRAKHNDLAIIQSNNNMIQIQNEAQRQHFSSGAWIALYYDINFCWSLGTIPLGSMRPWYPGDPNNAGGNEMCGALFPNGWFDSGCSNHSPFVCYDDTKTGTSRYIYISTTMSWPDAQAYCRTYYTDLTSSRDPTENAVIVSLLSGSAWFGLFRGCWKWTDQNSSSSITWMPGKPENALKNKNCGYLNSTRAANAECLNVMPFFCHSDITEKQQIMSLKIRSNQDVNDPAVKATVLEQIKQKLKDRGMTDNISVTWRKQPDGKVFRTKQKIEDALNLYLS